MIFLCFCLRLSMCSYNLFKKLIIESNQLILGASGYWEDSDHTWDSEYYFTCNTNESTVKVSTRSLYISPFFYDYYYFWLLLLFCLEQRCYLKSISSRGEFWCNFLFYKAYLKYVSYIISHFCLIFLCYIFIFILFTF